MWYVLQLTVFCTVVYYYETEIAPEAHVGHILIFAYLVTFCVTYLLGKLFDLVIYITRPKLVLPPKSTPNVPMLGAQRPYKRLHIRRTRD